MQVGKKVLAGISLYSVEMAHGDLRGGLAQGTGTLGELEDHADLARLSAPAIASGLR